MKQELPSYDELQSYDDVINHLKERQKHLLLGNGFSMSYDSNIFSYNALSQFLDKSENEVLQKLFHIVKTSNFELMMQQLENVAQIAEVFGADKTVVNNIRQATTILKESLIDAIKDLHPEHVFAIPDEASKACAEFLNVFLSNKGHIFTTNYDLLLYWVLMRNEIENAMDGFGRDVEEKEEWIASEDRQYSELRWGKYKEKQTIHYLHGALQLFDEGIEIIKEEYSGGEHLLLQNIKERMEKKNYPIFVTAGNGNEKLIHIVHNKYLSYCYETLSKINGSLIVFGFGFGEYDEHIIAAINKACKKRQDKNMNWNMLNSLYIGVFSENGLEHIKTIEKKFHCPVRVFDAKTLKIWG